MNVLIFFRMMSGAASTDVYWRTSPSPKSSVGLKVLDHLLDGFCRSMGLYPKLAMIECSPGISFCRQQSEFLFPEQPVECCAGHSAVSCLSPKLVRLCASALASQ